MPCYHRELQGPYAIRLLLQTQPERYLYAQMSTIFRAPSKFQESILNHHHSSTVYPSLPTLLAAPACTIHCITFTYSHPSRLGLTVLSICMTLSPGLKAILPMTAARALSHMTGTKLPWISNQTGIFAFGSCRCWCGAGGSGRRGLPVM